jgi:hypothetical protein
MKRHILLERAFKFPVERPTAGDLYPGWCYDRRRGAWISVLNNELMVTEATNPPRPRPQPQPRPEPPNPRPPRPVSKKADAETGEDMKGE